MPEAVSLHPRQLWRAGRRNLESCLAVLLAFAATVPFVFRQPGDWFNVYVPAAARMWHGGSVYPNPEGYVYPPLGALLASPFLGLPPFAGLLLWLAVNAIALAILCRGAWFLVGGKSQFEAASFWRESSIALLGLVCSLPYALDALANQQTDLILGALVIGGCLLLQRGRALAAALLFGLAAAVKCTPLLWAPYLAWRRRWSAALLVFVAAIGFNLLPDVLSTPHSRPRLADWTTDYLAKLARRDHDVGTWSSAIQFNHSIAGLTNRLTLVSATWEDGDLSTSPRASRPGAHTLRAMVYGTSFALVVVAAMAGWRRRSAAPGSPENTSGLAPALEYSLVCLLMLLLSPMSSKPHFCTLILPGLCLARLAIQGRALVPMLLLATAIGATLASNKDLVGKQTYSIVIWYGSVFWSTALLYAGCCWSLWRGDLTSQGERPEAQRLVGRAA
jgi:hypothetical protein